MGSKVRDYNIPGMPFRVHQFGTPVPSLRRVHGAACANARVFSLPSLPPFPCPGPRCAPFQTSAKLRGSASLLPLPWFLPHLCPLRARRNERFNPFQEGPAIQESVNTYLLFLAPFPLRPLPPPFFARAYVNCTKSFLKLHKYAGYFRCILLYFDTLNFFDLKYICSIFHKVQREMAKKNCDFQLHL